MDQIELSMQSVQIWAEYTRHMEAINKLQPLMTQVQDEINAAIKKGTTKQEEKA
jgi:hypothetical protein